MKKCLDEYSDEESDEESDKMFKESTKIKSSNKDENTTNWYDKSKFKKILTTIDSNNFTYKNKIDKFKFNDTNNLINNIKNNIKTISEADTKKKIDELNKTKNVETKGKRLIKSQEKLLSLFDDLKTIFNTDNNNNNNNNNNNSNSDNNKKLFLKTLPKM